MVSTRISGTNLFAVRVLIINTGANDALLIQADDKIENRGPVADIDLFTRIFGPYSLFGQ